MPCILAPSLDRRSARRATRDRARSVEVAAIVSAVFDSSSCNLRFRDDGHERVRNARVCRVDWQFAEKTLGDPWPPWNGRHLPASDTIGPEPGSHRFPSSGTVESPKPFTTQRRFSTGPDFLQNRLGWTRWTRRSSNPAGPHLADSFVRFPRGVRITYQQLDWGGRCSPRDTGSLSVGRSFDDKHSF